MFVRRRRFLIAAMAVVLLSTGALAAAPAAEPSWPEPTVGPLVSGTSGYLDGVFFATDYAYDDRGADTDGRAGGNASYPSALPRGNAADVVQTQLRLDGGTLHVRVVLQTLLDEQVPLLGIGFDTDQEPATGAATLPGSAWEPDGPLGLERLLVVDGTEARLLDLAGDGGVLVSVDAEVSTSANTVDVAVPAGLVGPVDRAWDVLGVAGVTVDPWTHGGEIYDLALLAGEEAVHWQENRQAQVLAGRAPAAEAFATFDPRLSVAGHTDLPDEHAAGFSTFLHVSALTLSEGVESDATGADVFLGRYQPYLVYVPGDQDVTAPGPMTVYLHGAYGNHLGAVFVPFAGYLGTVRPGSTDPGVAGPAFGGLTPQSATLPANLTVYPLGRGLSLFYEGIGEVDVLEVMAEAERRFAVDPDRVTIMGASMGGMGTFRMAGRYPDRFAAAYPLIGDARYARQMLGNLQHVPVRMVNGLVDPLVPQPAPTEDAERLAEAGIEHRYWLKLARHHESDWAELDCILSQTATDRRVSDPASVHYTADPATFRTDPEAGYELRYGGAYWVSDMVVRDGSAPGSVDADSHARPFRERVAEHTEELRTSVALTNLCGDARSLPGRDVWRETALTFTDGAERALREHLELDLANLAGLTVDLAGAGFPERPQATVAVRSDGPAALTLLGLAPGVRALVDGRVVAVAGGKDALRVNVGQGTTHIALR